MMRKNKKGNDRVSSPKRSSDKSTYHKFLRKAAKRIVSSKSKNGGGGSKIDSDEALARLRDSGILDE